MAGPSRSSPLYFDHAATRWPKAAGVADAIAMATRDLVGNAGRSSDDSAAHVMDRCRCEVARLIHVPEANRIVLTHGCTDALNLAILGLLAHRNDKPHVVSTVLEHNSVRRPLLHLARLGVISLIEVGCDAEGFVDPGELSAACTPRTALVTCTHVSNVVGAIQPIEAIVHAAKVKAPQAMILIDAAQSVGVLEVDPLAWGADLLAFGAHKSIGGPAGIGVLFVGPRAFVHANPPQSLLRPIAFGGTGESGTADADDLPTQMPERFEVGTRNAAGAAGFIAALQVLPRDGSVIAHERALLSRLLDGVRTIVSLRAIGTSDVRKRVGVLALQPTGMSAVELAAVLQTSFSIITRAGVQCAPAAHAALGTAPDGTLRVSVGPQTTAEDVDQLLAALAQVCGG